MYRIWNNIICIIETNFERNGTMKNNMILAIHYHHPKGTPQFFAIYENGKMICSGNRVYKLQPQTISRLRSILRKAAIMMIFIPSQVVGCPGEFITNIQCFSRTITVTPSAKDYDEFHPNRYSSRFVFQLKSEIYRMLEQEEPLFISGTTGVYMLERTHNISHQIQEICKELRSAEDVELQYALFVFLLTALYWFNHTVYFLTTNDEPTPIDSRYYFCLEEDILDNRNYSALPYRELLNLLMKRYDEVKLGYQPVPQWYYSTDAIRDCFFDCKTL